jgi:hypothetical protein
MKNIKQSVTNLGEKYKPKCNPKKGEWNSCEPCTDCHRRMKFIDEEYPPLVFGYELREDGDIELREDGDIELRQN